MLAAPIPIPTDSANGPRPIDLREDADSIIKLLDATFGPLRGGQREIGDRVALNLDPPLLYRMATLTWKIRPGFVWEENGQIIGNVTLVKSEIRGRFLIANVAVHPDYRRMGIARQLLEQSIDYINQLKGRDVLLQVRQQNSAAIRLYESLDFTPLGPMNHWESTTSRVRTPAVEESAIASMRKLRAGEWQAAAALDRVSLEPDLTWPSGLKPDKYSRGFLSRIGDFLSAKRIETWVAEEPGVRDHNRHLSGLVNLADEWRRPLRLELRVHPKAVDDIGRLLLIKGLSRLKSWRSGYIRMTHHAGDEHINDLLLSSNFTLKETLLVMRLSLH